MPSTSRPIRLWRVPREAPRGPPRWALYFFNRLLDLAAVVPLRDLVSTLTLLRGSETLDSTSSCRPVMQRCRILILFALGVLFATLPAGSLSAQSDWGSVAGRVLDEASGQGIPVARVEIVDPEGRILASTSTDSDGEFRLENLAEGPVRLRAERIGYAAGTREERVVGGETLVLTLRLSPEFLTLAPFEVGARARARPAELEAFRDRAGRGVGGTHITRREIEIRSPGRISDLLVGVPGLRVSEGSLLGHSDRRITLAWALPGQAGGRCPVQIFLNGTPAPDLGRNEGLGGRSGVDGVRVDHLAHPSTLEGIEIYTDLASVPPAFLTPDAACGVIALWTRIQSL